MRGAALHDRLVLAVAALFLCAHLAWLPGQLEDIDSLNFALGLREYDVAAHQPHPPGYPVFTVLARGVATVVSPWARELATRDALAMGALSALAGAVALLLLHRAVGLVLTADARRDEPYLPCWVTTLTAATPLFWVTASRPLSDMTGLAGALGCQVLLLDAARPSSTFRRAAVAALASGVAVGLRSQVMWLVVPLLLWLAARTWRRRDARAAAGLIAIAAAGVCVWAVPMVVATGGISAYRTALTSQAGEDFEGVPMLVLEPGIRRLAVALGDTFVWPWGWWSLAVVLIALASAGLLALRGRRRVATWIGLGYAPYLVYHLLFQETETTRYALPLVPPIAMLAMLGLVHWTPRIGRAVAAIVCGVALGVSVHAQRQYVTADVGVGSVLRRMEAAARESSERPQVLMHRRVWAETRRARSVLAPAPSYDVLAAPRSREWQGGAQVWKRGAARVWWMVDPRRGDRVAIDPRALTLRQRVAWPMPVAAVLGGMRPHAFDWYDVAPPQWLLQDGWGLTPELAGLTAAAGQGPSGSGAAAMVRGQDGPATLVVGGRFVAPAGSTGTLTVRIDDTWRQDVQVVSGPFAAVWSLPPGALTGDGYRTLRASAGGGEPASATMYLEQFDLQPEGTPVIGLGRGWYEPERDPVTGRQWRWVDAESVIQVAGATGDVRLVIAGTYPRHYDRAPVLEILAGADRVATHTLTRPFRIEQVIPARQLRDAGRVTWRVAPSFIAGERTGTADARRLALEIATVQAHAIR